MVMLAASGDRDRIEFDEEKEIVNGDTGPPAASVVESKTIGGHARHWVHAIPPLCSSQPTSSALSVQ